VDNGKRHVQNMAREMDRARPRASTIVTLCVVVLRDSSDGKQMWETKGESCTRVNDMGIMAVYWHGINR
jgi:hypothetical protein